MTDLHVVVIAAMELLDNEGAIVHWMKRRVEEIIFRNRIDFTNGRSDEIRAGRENLTSFRKM